MYQNALLIALQDKGLAAKSQIPISVSFRSEPASAFLAEIVVDDKIILELKAVSALAPIHKAQVINYLKATGIEVGLLINFGSSKLEYRRLHS